MAHGGSAACAAETAKTDASKIEVLLMQPFSPAPLLCFEDVPVGAEAIRLVAVRNLFNTSSTVFVERVPSDKGFAVDPEVFVVAAGSEQLVKVLWKPENSGASCTATVNIRSDRGYRGMLVLLATVKSTKQARRQPQKSSAATLGNSQRARVPGPSGCKEVAQPSKTTKQNITIPKEFKSRTEMRQKCRASSHTAYSEAQSISTPRVQGISKFADQSSQRICKETFTPYRAAVADPIASEIRQETFICNKPGVATAAGTTDSDDDFEDSLNPVPTTTVDSEEKLDSPDVGPTSPTSGGTESAGFSPSTVMLYKSKAKATYREDLSDSSSSSNFSERMEALYEEVIKRQDLADIPDPLESSEFRIRMDELYEKSLARRQSRQVHFDGGNRDTKMQVIMQSTPMHSKIKGVGAELDLGRGANIAGPLCFTQGCCYDGRPEDFLPELCFFPSDISGICGPPMDQ